MSQNNKYNVNAYKDLENFAKNITKGKLSIKKAKKEQDELWGLIFKMKKKIGKKKSRGRKLNKSGEKDMTKLIKDADKIYKTRNDIIRAFENKELIEPDFESINNTDAFNKVLDRANKNIGIEARSDDKLYSF